MTERKAPSAHTPVQRNAGLAPLVLILLLLILAFAATSNAASMRPAGAAPGALTARLEFNPSYRELAVGDVLTASVNVSDATDLFGYELHITFDPSVLHVVDMDLALDGVNMAPGDFVRPDFVAINSASNITGTADIAVTQVGGEGHSGAGALAVITFQAVNVGQGLVQFSSYGLSNSSGVGVHADAVAPIYVVLGATATPTNSVTPGPSPTPTVTRTPTITRTPTPTSATATPSASPTPHFYLDPQIRELGPGETAQMAVRTSYVEGLGGVSIYMRWDPTLFEVVDALTGVSGTQIAPGDLFAGHGTFRPSNGNQVDNVAGTLVYVLSLTEPTGLNGQWTVATITLHAIGTGACAFEFYGDTMMANPQTGDLPSGYISGEVRVVTATSTPTITREPTIPLPTETPTVTPTETETPTATPTETLTPTITPTETETPTVTPTVLRYIRFPLALKNRNMQ